MVKEKSSIHKELGDYKTNRIIDNWENKMEMGLLKQVGFD